MLIQIQQYQLLRLCSRLGISIAILELGFKHVLAVMVCHFKILLRLTKIKTRMQSGSAMSDHLFSSFGFGVSQFIPQRTARHIPEPVKCHPRWLHAPIHGSNFFSSSFNVALLPAWMQKCPKVYLKSEMYMA